MEGRRALVTLERELRQKGLMQASGIPVPHHIVVHREKLPEGQQDPEGFIETEDYVELNGEPPLCA